MKKKKLIMIIAIAVAVVLVASLVLSLTLCGGNKSEKSSINIMTDELSGLFNPFYATSGADQDVIGMTQIGMLSTDKNGKTVAGDDYATVVKDYTSEEVKEGDTVKETVYTFVIKNGIKFSDGKPLTMNDVLFNMYEYLDPVYTGSSTMYSIKIKGLKAYRTQKNESGDSNIEETLSRTAETRATNRIQELQRVYSKKGLLPGSTSSYFLSVEDMETAIASWTVSDAYKRAVALESEWSEIDWNQQLLEDYRYALKTFKEELQSDFNAAKESFDTTKMPYSEHADKLESDVFKFLLYEGKITPVYADLPETSRPDKNKILWFDNEILAQNSKENREKTEEEAIDLIFNDNVESKLLNVLSFWGTAGTLQTTFAAAAKDVLLHANLSGDELAIPNIEGIVSLGHTTNVDKVVVNGTTYNVAHNHNEDGTPSDANSFDVLQITVDGVDPKAIYNFGFTVAPVHYYSGLEVDIANNKFGVEWSSSEFQSKVIQKQEHQEVPVGAGPFKATDANDNDNPKGSDFVKAKTVYYKKNDYFMFPVKAERIRLVVVSSTNAIDKLVSGEVDYITPQFTVDNEEKLDAYKSSGIEKLYAWQLGYGYIGINAGKVKNINIRKAIMSAMQTSLALEYYKPSTAKTINWPMSMESWAYPWIDGDRSKGQKPNDPDNDYMSWGDNDTKSTVKKTEADYVNTIAKIKKYMAAAGVSAGDSSLKFRFTIAGSSISEHPVYPVFLQAADILNNYCGWEVEVKADSQALTKLATGSLEVWAAAWGSTIDPDMYQVYHKNSTATSVYAWGYREIKASASSYPEETRIINQLSDIIDDAREITDTNRRTELYEQAMGLVLDLAVEMPVYQRQNLYAYNSKVVKGFATEVNPYTSPLEKIWELELVK